MKRPSDGDDKDRGQFQRLIGLGDLSARKSYYPALQATIENLEKEKEKFERIFADALNGIFQSTLHGRTIIANPAMAQICGYGSPEEFITTINDVGSQLFYRASEYNQLIDRLRTDRFVVDYEAEFKRKDNELIVVSMNARFNEIESDGYIEFFVQDISDRKRDEDELRKYREHLEELVKERTAEIEKAHQSLIDNEERFRGLSEASFEGIVIIDELRIVDVNSTICKMLGYKPSEIIGMEAIEVVPPDLRDRLKRKIESGDEQLYASYCLRKDGSIFPTEVHARMFSYKGRKVRVSAIRDMTEQKKAEAEIKTLRGILPICSSCKKIRDDKGYWNQIEGYIRSRSEAEFSHSICPECAKEIYPNFVKKRDKLRK